MNERVRQVTFTISKLKRKQHRLSTNLSSLLPDEIWDRVKLFTEAGQLSQHRITKQRQFDKFAWLSSTDQQQNGIAGPSLVPEAPKWVKNLSNLPLSHSEKSLLAKGINFAVVPDKIPSVEFITATEEAIAKAKLGETEAELVRNKICSSLCKIKLPPSNLNIDKRKALSVLTKDDTIAIVPADKGKCVGIWDKENYNNKCTDLLKDRNTYKPVGYNLTYGFKEKVSKFTAKLFLDCIINVDEKRKLDPPSKPTYHSCILRSTQNPQTRAHPCKTNYE